VSCVIAMSLAAVCEENEVCAWCVRVGLKPFGVQLMVKYNVVNTERTRE
jgi:hypothetical protein